MEEEGDPAGASAPLISRTRRHIRPRRAGCGACFAARMTRNVGRLEWKVRVAAGIVGLAIAFFIELPALWEGVFGTAGVALLLTGLVRYCPLNQLFGRHPKEAS